MRLDATTTWRHVLAGSRPNRCDARLPCPSRYIPPHCPPLPLSIPQIEIKRAVPRDAMPPSPRTLPHRPPAGHHHAGPGMYDAHAPGPEMWHRRGPPPHYGGRGGGYGGPAGYRGYSGPAGYAPPPHHHSYGTPGGRGAGMRSPPHHGHHGGSGLPPQPFTPPAVVTGGASRGDVWSEGRAALANCGGSWGSSTGTVVPAAHPLASSPPSPTGIPANMAATPEGAAAIASGGAVAAALPVMSTPMVMPSQTQLAAMSAAAGAQLQPGQLVAGFGGLPSGVQAAAAAAAAQQLGSPPGAAAFGLQDSAAAAAQQQAAAAAQAQAAHNLAELQQQVNLSTSLAQAQLQQAQAAAQQQQAQAAIWS